MIPREVIPRRVVRLVKITPGGRGGKWAHYTIDGGGIGKMRLYLWNELKRVKR